MYKKESEGLLKHWDFALLDMISLQVAFVLAYCLRGYGINPYANVLYRNMTVFIELADLVVLFTFGTLKNVLKLGHYKNFVITVKHAMIVGAMAVFYLFALQQGHLYSRLALGFLIVFYIMITYLSREFWKSYLKKRTKEKKDRSLLIVALSDMAESVIHNISENNYAGFMVDGIALLDRTMNEKTQETISGVRIVADAQTTPMYVCQEWIDEVLVVLSNQGPYPKELINQLEETGVVVHITLTNIDDVIGKRQFVERIGNYTVLTTSINYTTAVQLFFKRLMDICGGIVGCLITGILFIFVAPVIYISSPGPIFFIQERVGRNGKRFKMYKFRSMYMDAEERKAELMKYNTLVDGKMFKMDFDPRIIGNKILPDGTKKTGIGAFIRATSIDEFPQFINVLKGDMSIVGTRPPLISETELYELHHRARLAIKPGVTGLWQVSGRSDITDFEEVVRLDKTYISNWNIGLDIKILLKTVMVVLKRDGSR